MSDEEQGAELVMPFVTVASKGGPHDDAAYVAGWEMGALDAMLSAAPEVCMQLRHTIHSVNAPQADLIAMRHGFKSRVTVFEECPEWSTVELWKGDRS